MRKSSKRSYSCSLLRTNHHHTHKSQFIPFIYFRFQRVHVVEPHKSHSITSLSRSPNKHDMFPLRRAKRTLHPNLKTKLCAVVELKWQISCCTSNKMCICQISGQWKRMMDYLLAGSEQQRTKGGTVTRICFINCN